MSPGTTRRTRRTKRTERRRRRPTTKEGRDGRLYLVRDDGRVRRLGRRAAARALRRAPPAVLERVLAAYDAAEEAEANARVLEAERRILARERAATVLRAAGWAEDVDGSFVLRRGGELRARTDPETVAEFAERLGPEALRRKLVELGRGDG